MSYITKADVKARLPRQWQTLYTANGVVDESLIDGDIAAVEAELDGYFAKRYAVPVTGGLDLVRNWGLSLLEELAYSRSANAELPKKVSDRVVIVRKALRDVADGRLTLGTDPTPVANAAGSDGGFIVVSGNEPQFTRAKMDGF